jgi:hypothetical protein
MMRAEIAGENPTPLEVLLTERVVACWLLVELVEWLMATQLWKGNPPENRVTLAALKYYLRWQESANRFFVASVRGARQGKEAAEHNAGDLVQHADQRESPARIPHSPRGPLRVSLRAAGRGLRVSPRKRNGQVAHAPPET